MSDRPLPILIDTDIGDDIDDALALALALRSREVDLRAVTTVFGPVEARTRLALKLLDTYGRPDIPVATGRGAPLFGERPDHEPNQAVVLEEGDTLPAASLLAADELILRAAEEADGALTIITIGATTNMAVALLRDPSLAERARLIAMAGVAGRQQAEWNVWCDPEAARICFDSGIPLTMVGLDVTLQCKMTEEQVGRIASAGTPETALLSRLIEAWAGSGDGQRKKRLPILHDPLAVAVAFRPELVTVEAKRVRVETRGELTRGFTVTGGGEPQARVCMAVDAEGFLDMFVERVAGGCASDLEAGT